MDKKKLGPSSARSRADFALIDLLRSGQFNVANSKSSNYFIAREKVCGFLSYFIHLKNVEGGCCRN